MGIFSESANRNYKIFIWIMLTALMTSTLYSINLLSQISYRNNVLYPIILKSDRNFDKLAAKVGYGGLVHYYYLCLVQNYLESNVCDIADAKARSAISITYEIESTSKQLGLDPGLESARKAFTSFRVNIAKIRVMKSKNYSIEKIVKTLNKIHHPEYGKYAVVRNEVRYSLKNHVIIVQKIYEKLYLTGLFALITIFIFIAYFYKQGRRIEEAFEKALTAKRLALANIKLRDSNDALAQFASVASHDLKAPVRHVALFADAIRRSSADNPEIIEHIDNITQSTNEMNALINSLLTFSKSGFRNPKLAECSLEEIVQSAQKSAITTDRDVVFTTDYNGIDTIHADENLLKQAIGNVISNSVKYISKDVSPEISVSVTDSSDYITIEISDNGIGIPPHLSETVFQPMRRLHGVESIYEGTGLGLTLVRTIMRAHGGNAEIDTSYTGGTRVILTMAKHPLETY